MMEIARQWTFKQRLLESARNGDLSSLQAAVQEYKIEIGTGDTSIDAIDNDGETCLHLAAFHGHSLIVRWILSDSGGRAAGFRGPLARTEGGATALHYACRQGHLECVQALVEGSKVDNGEREALVNAVNDGEWTTLHFAVYNGHSSIIRWLLSDSGGRAAGFDSLLTKDDEGVTALHLACEKNHLECVQALVECSRIDNGEREALIRSADDRGWTALHFASCYGDESTVQWLLSESGVPSTITAKTKRSESILHCAASGSVDVLRTLLSQCTSAERMNLFLCVDNKGWTVLHHAVGYGQPEIIRELLLHHPETQMIVDHRDHRGMTALHRAVIEGLDDESREEWRTQLVYFSTPSYEETIVALLTTPSNGEESQQQAAQIDPNVGLKFD